MDPGRRLPPSCFAAIVPPAATTTCVDRRRRSTGPRRSPFVGDGGDHSRRRRHLHIVAANKLDGLFGLGYAHAQDRLWQMEFQRRIGHGRLSGKCSARRRFRRTVFSAPSVSAAARAAWSSTPGLDEAAGQRVRSRRQCVHHDASRRQAAAGVLPAPIRARTVDRRRRIGLGEDDGVGLERKLFVLRRLHPCDDAFAAAREQSGDRAQLIVALAVPLVSPYASCTPPAGTCADVPDGTVATQRPLALS